MSFQPKTDWFGLQTLTDGVLQVKSSDDGNSAELAEAHDEKGSFIASQMFGESCSPSCDYAVGNGTISLKLGQLNNITYKESDTRTICLESVSISTSAGGEPTFSASGQQVEDVATPDADDWHYYAVPAFSMGSAYHCEPMFENSVTLSGEGCHFTSVSYTIGCTINKSTKDGEALSHDVTEGKIEMALEIVQTSTTKPTVEVGTGWGITAPLSCSNPDADYPSWTCTAVMYLEHHTNLEDGSAENLEDDSSASGLV